MPDSLLTYLLPVHNETGVLARNVERLLARLEGHPGSRIFLVENGSTDDSAQLVRGLEGRYAGRVRSFVEPSAGIGFAYQRGIEEWLREAPSSAPEWIVLSASDLPFEFSDLEVFLQERQSDPNAAIFIGSKAHARSVVRNSPKRRMASLAYRVLRRAVLGMRVRDPQGTFFIRKDAAAALAKKIRSRGFFYTTELVYWAEQAGFAIREIPVRYIEESDRKSSVKIFKHGRQMFFQMLELRNCK